MTLPIPSEMTAAVGQILTASAWNSNVRDGINFLLNPPLFIGNQSVAQSIPNNAFTSITFDSETVDTYGGHSTVTNTSRYTAQVAGWHLVLGRCAATGAIDTKRIISIAVNGSGVWNDEDDDATTNLQTNKIAQMVFLNVGDYVEVQYLQNTGGAINTNVTSAYWPSMAVLWVHA